MTFLYIYLNIPTHIFIGPTFFKNLLMKIYCMLKYLNLKGTLLFLEGILPDLLSWYTCRGARFSSGWTDTTTWTSEGGSPESPPVCCRSFSFCTDHTEAGTSLTATELSTTGSERQSKEVFFKRNGKRYWMISCTSTMVPKNSFKLLLLFSGSLYKW